MPTVASSIMPKRIFWDMYSYPVDTFLVEVVERLSLFGNQTFFKGSFWALFCVSHLLKLLMSLFPHTIYPFIPFIWFMTCLSLYIINIFTRRKGAKDRIVEGVGCYLGCKGLYIGALFFYRQGDSSPI